MKAFANKQYWALILGGSSGIGLATAKKLAREGMNLFIVHRDRRGAMAQIQPEFDQLKTLGVQVETFNTNALAEEGRQEVLAGMADHLKGGKVRVMLHSIALGNLKLIAPMPPKKSQAEAVAKLALELGVDATTLQKKIDTTFDAGAYSLAGVATPTTYNQDNMTNDEDMAQTIYNMGTNLLTWTQELFRRSMFAADARVLGLTSEGNEIAWRGYAAVAAAKCALESVSRAIAVEMAPHGIRSNILQPGITNTAALNLIPGSGHMKADALRRNPLGRMTTPEDVANAVYLLSLDESAWINGTIVRVDGGEHISG